MVAILTMLLALGAVGSGEHSEVRTETQSLVYTAPQGWTAEVVAVSIDKVIEVLDGKQALIHYYEDPDNRQKLLDAAKSEGQSPEEYLAERESIFKLAELIAGDTEGHWLHCKITLNGNAFECWRETRAVINMRNGTTIQSTAVVAVTKSWEREIVSTGQGRFIVSKHLPGGSDGTVTIYLRFSEGGELKNVVNWRLVNWR